MRLRRTNGDEKPPPRERNIRQSSGCFSTEWLHRPNWLRIAKSRTFRRARESAGPKAKWGHSGPAFANPNRPIYRRVPISRCSPASHGSATVPSFSLPSRPGFSRECPCACGAPMVMKTPRRGSATFAKVSAVFQQSGCIDRIRIAKSRTRWCARLGRSHDRKQVVAPTELASYRKSRTSRRAQLGTEPRPRGISHGLRPPSLMKSTKRSRERERPNTTSIKALSQAGVVTLTAEEEITPRKCARAGKIGIKQRTRELAVPRLPYVVTYRLVGSEAVVIIRIIAHADLRGYSPLSRIVSSFGELAQPAVNGFLDHPERHS
jgi:hypothetical protein